MLSHLHTRGKTIYGRWMILAVVLMGVQATGLAGEALITRTIEDCEGQLAGWPQQAQLTEDARHGQRAIQWRPKKDAGPHFLRFDFADRNVELANWDKLQFDYKFTKRACKWWGVKIVDFPLGDGMQATWRIANDSGITPGHWQQAVIDLQNPRWLWGDKPNREAQTITFRCQFKEGASSAILIDNIRLQRLPIRLEQFTAAKTARDGDVLRRSYTLTVRNNMEKPARLQIQSRNADAKLNVNIHTASITVPAQEVKQIQITASCDIGGDNPPAPLSALSADIVVRPTTVQQKEEVRKVKVTVPIEEIPHPSLLITSQQADNVMEKVEAEEYAREAYEAIKRRADAWLEKTPEFPEQGGQWWHWYTCDECGARLETKGPHKHVCPQCGEVYSGWPYDQVVLNRKHGALSKAARNLGLMYVLTGRDEYAKKTREILMGYAERYLDYPLHNVHGEPSKGGGHVGPQTLDEATWLIPIVQGFDCIYNTLSDDDRDFIAEKMLLPAAELIHEHQWGIHNICCWHASAYGLVGLTLGNQQLIEDAIAGPKGFRSQVAEGITDDGFWYESSWGYHFHTMSALEPLAIAAYNVGIDLYSQRYKGMYDAPLQFMAPGGKLPAFNDSGRATAIGRSKSYEIAYARWGDPRHLLPIMNSSRRSLQALLYGVTMGEPEAFRLDSTTFPTAGYVILRNGETGPGKIGRHIPANYLAFDYGPHGGGHGHPDKLGFVLYGHGKLLAEDAGSIAYGNPAHKGWFKQTLSHSTVVADGSSQQPCTGQLQFTAFARQMSICSARADEAYPHARLRRTLALTGDRVIDVYTCRADTPVTFDWVYHNRGEFTCNLPLSKAEAPADSDGYQWAENWRKAQTDGAWSAIWRQEDGPKMMLVQAGAAGDRSRQVFAATGMGNPPRIDVPFVICRSEAKSAVYCSALQIYDDEAPPKTRVSTIATSRIDGSAETSADKEKPAAVEVSGGGVRDVLLVNPAGGVMQAGKFKLVGQGALLHYEDNRLVNMLVVSDGTVSVNGRPIEQPQ